MKPQNRPPGKTASQVGFWSAVLATVWAVWFIAAFGIYAPGMLAEWPGIEAFAASFESTPYLLWVLPCLLLALIFPVLMSSIHFRTPDDRRIWSWLGLVFAIMYGAVLSANYWLLLTVVRESLLSGYSEGLAWFVIGSPHSITNTLEGIGYAFMGLAMLFASRAFEGERLERWLRWVFMVNGVAGIAGAVLGGVGFMAGTWVSLAVWCVSFPAGTVLVALLFKQAKSAGPAFLLID